MCVVVVDWCLDVEFLVFVGEVFVVFGFNGVGKFIVLYVIVGLFCFDVGLVCLGDWVLIDIEVGVNVVIYDC